MWQALTWGFDLLNVNWVHSLSYELHGPDIVIVTDEEDDQPAQYFLSSEHLNDLNDPASVAARGAALKVLFDGALFLSYGLNHSPQRLGDLVNFREDRRIGSVSVSQAVEPFSAVCLERPLSRDEMDAIQSNRIQGAIYLARTDGVVRGMLTILGTDGVTLRSLYSLRDFMKTHGFTDDQIAKAGGTTKTEINRFTHTANNFRAAGAAARHGDLGQQPPASPMEVDQAAAFVLKAARAFVDERLVAGISKIR